MGSEHALVCGASIAGLLAARVSSDFYATVTVVERDKLPAGTSQRRGVSQGRYLHQMLGRGVPYLVDLFPGLLEELEAAGAIVLDSPDDPAQWLATGERQQPSDRVRALSDHLNVNSKLQITAAVSGSTKAGLPGLGHPILGHRKADLQAPRLPALPPLDSAGSAHRRHRR